MRTHIVLGAGALAALVALAPVASSTHFCTNYTVYYVGAGSGGPNVAYVAEDCGLVDPCELFTIWVYMESNGVPDLQRGGVTLAGDMDICQNYAVGHDQGVF